MTWKGASPVLCAQVEALAEVERAFVHVDYETRDEPEHKVERNLLSGSRNLLRAHDSVRYQAGTLHSHRRDTQPPFSRL